MFLSNEAYNHIVDRQYHGIKKTPLLEELVQWAKSEIDIPILDYFCDFTNTGLLRLNLVLSLEVTDDYKQTPNTEGWNRYYF